MRTGFQQLIDFVDERNAAAAGISVEEQRELEAARRQQLDAEIEDLMTLDEVRALKARLLRADKYDASLGDELDAVLGEDWASPKAIGALTDHDVVPTGDSLKGGDQYVTVRVPNVPAVLAAQGGPAAAVAYAAAPVTVTRAMYDKIAEKLVAGFKAEGVNAVVTVASGPVGPATRSDFLPGIVVGGVLSGLLAGAVVWIRHLARRK